MQRFCDGCRRYHDLASFDLDREDASAVCREYALARARTFRAGVRRAGRSKIEALEQHRRGLIAALVKIDQEIDKARALQALKTTSPTAVSQGGAAVEESFSSDSDLDPGD